MSEPMKKLPPKSAVPGKAKLVQPTNSDKTYVLHRERKPRGIKILVYGASGMGKTTICTELPDPVFVATDDGIDEIVNPITGEVIPSYKAGTYEDLRNILAQPKLFEGFKTIVLDNMTEAENLAVPYILEHVLRDGVKVKSLEGYGWGAGYAHLADHDNYVKYDLQRLVDLGFNVAVICQLSPRKETSAEVPDYFKDGPKLVYRPGSKAFAVTDFVEWSDYCFKIGYTTMKVSDKRVTSSGQRVIFVSPETHFEAKARGFPVEVNGSPLTCVSFNSPSDDTIWRFVFDKAWE